MPEPIMFPDEVNWKQGVDLYKYRQKKGRNGVE